MTDPIDELPADLLAALRAPAEVDDDVRERHLAAALERFDDDRSGPEAEAPARVVSLASRRRSRILAVAAGVVLVVGAVAVLTHRSGGDAVQSAGRVAAADRPAAATAGPDARTATTPGATGAEFGAETAGPSVPTTDLDHQQLSTRTPAVDSTAAANGTDAVVAGGSAASAASVPGSSAGSVGPPPATSGSRTCAAPLMRASYVSTATATVGGRDVLVFTYAWGPGGSHLVRVDVDPQSCART